MKVFLSLPMHGYNAVEISIEMAKMERAIIAKFNDNDDINGAIEFVTNFECIPKNGVKHAGPYCLANAIEKIAYCDLVVFHPNYENDSSCRIEYRVCNVYDIRYHVLDEEDMNI